MERPDVHAAGLPVRQDRGERVKRVVGVLSGESVPAGPQFRQGGEGAVLRGVLVRGECQDSVLPWIRARCDS